jgi:hypothetical protein
MRIAFSQLVFWSWRLSNSRTCYVTVLSFLSLSLSLSDSLDPSDHFRVALLCSPSLRSVVFNSVHYPAYTGNGVYTMANGVAPPTMESLYRSAPYRMSVGQKLTFDLLSKTPCLRAYVEVSPGTLIRQVRSALDCVPFDFTFLACGCRIWSVEA